MFPRKIPTAFIYTMNISEEMMNEYTTLSPCAMCSGAISLYGIPRVIVGENVTFTGEEELLRSRGVQVEVLQNVGCISLMRSFIEANPKLWNEDIGV